MIGELGKDKLAAAAWQRETSSDLAHDQHDVLIAVQDVLGAAFVKMDTVFRSLATNEPGYGGRYHPVHLSPAELSVALEDILAQFRLIQSAFEYVNTCTNEVKKTYSRAAYCFDLSRPQLLRQKALMSTAEDTTESNSEVAP